MARSWRENKDEEDKAKAQKDWRTARKAAKRQKTKDEKVAKDVKRVA